MVISLKKKICCEYLLESPHRFHSITMHASFFIVCAEFAIQNCLLCFIKKNRKYSRAAYRILRSQTKKKKKKKKKRNAMLAVTRPCLQKSAYFKEFGVLTFYQGKHVFLNFIRMCVFYDCLRTGLLSISIIYTRRGVTNSKSICNVNFGVAFLRCLLTFSMSPFALHPTELA